MRVVVAPGEVSEVSSWTIEGGGLVNRLSSKGWWCRGLTLNTSGEKLEFSI